MGFNFWLLGLVFGFVIVFGCWFGCGWVLLVVGDLVGGWGVAGVAICLFGWCFVCLLGLLSYYADLFGDCVCLVVGFSAAFVFAWCDCVGFGCCLVIGVLSVFNSVVVFRCCGVIWYLFICLV